MLNNVFSIFITYLNIRSFFVILQKFRTFFRNVRRLTCSTVAETRGESNILFRNTDEIRSCRRSVTIGSEGEIVPQLN
jgi:hypothetical protein